MSVFWILHPSRSGQKCRTMARCNWNYRFHYVLLLENEDDININQWKVLAILFFHRNVNFDCQKQQKNKLSEFSFQRSHCDSQIFLFVNQKGENVKKHSSIISFWAKMFTPQRCPLFVHFSASLSQLFGNNIYLFIAKKKLHFLRLERLDCSIQG